MLSHFLVASLNTLEIAETDKSDRKAFKAVQYPSHRLHYLLPQERIINYSGPY